MNEPAGPDDRSPGRFEYRPGTIRFGSGAVGTLSAELERRELERALVVCGSTVGDTPAVLDPVVGGLGDRYAGTFDETTPEKRLETAFDAVEAMDAVDADVFVGVGGGSSLDVATVASVLDASVRSPTVIGRELAERGTIAVPDGPLTPVVAVPTTLAGADLSQAAGVTASPAGGLVDRSVSGSVSDPRLLPAATVYDPSLVATTPTDILAGSAMNGFDKGVETLYARAATPVTDATASRGLELLARWLPRLPEAESADEDVYEGVLEGTMLVQYGVSRPDETTLSIVHAFGHALRTCAGVQQGVGHAIVVPHVLAYLFERVDARRALLADALGVPREDRSDEAVAEAVVDRVAGVRDALFLPSRLRSVDGLERTDLPGVAETVLDDRLIGNGPPGFEPTVAELEGVLERAW